jgi:hypothetical protein
LLLLGTDLGYGQAAERRVLIPDQVACANCSIITQTLDIGGPDDDHGAPIRVKTDGLGRIWVFSQDWPAKIYTSNGKFLRSIGARGAGPGEFGRGGWIYEFPGDSVAVMDRFNGRITIVAPDLRAVRTVPLADVSFWAAPAIGPRRFVGTGLLEFPGHVGWTLHAFKIDSSGIRIERSFGGPGQYHGESPGVFRWDVSPAASGRFWSAERLAYRLNLWDASGTSYLQLERKPEWFPPQTELITGNPDRAPTPRGQGISVDGDVIWTFTHVPESSWRRAWSEMPRGSESRWGPSEAELFDTIVEAIDAVAGRVVARTRIPYSVLNTLPGGRVVMQHRDADGHEKLQLLTLRVKR